jgi:hypothetical protein
MTKTEFQIIEMPGRVVAPGQADEDKLRKKSLAGYALASIGTGIAKHTSLPCCRTNAACGFVRRKIRIALDWLCATDANRIGLPIPR